MCRTPSMRSSPVCTTLPGPAFAYRQSIRWSSPGRSSRRSCRGSRSTSRRTRGPRPARSPPPRRTRPARRRSRPCRRCPRGTAPGRAARTPAADGVPSATRPPARSRARGSVTYVVTAVQPVPLRGLAERQVAHLLGAHPHVLARSVNVRPSVTTSCSSRTAGRAQVGVEDLGHPPAAEGEPHRALRAAVRGAERLLVGRLVDGGLAGPAGRITSRGGRRRGRRRHCQGPITALLIAHVHGARTAPGSHDERAAVALARVARPPPFGWTCPHAPRRLVFPAQQAMMRPLETTRGSA